MEVENGPLEDHFPLQTGGFPRPCQFQGESMTQMFTTTTTSQLAFGPALSGAPGMSRGHGFGPGGDGVHSSKKLSIDRTSASNQLEP